MTGAPLWLTISLGLVPVVTALLAGLFALTHPLGKRIDGLKTLIELRAKTPVAVNPSASLDKIIMSEMLTIERRTDPVIRRYRREIGIFLLLAVFPYVGTVFALRFDQTPNPFNRILLVIAVCAALLTALLLIRNRLDRIVERSDQIGRKYAEAVEPDLNRGKRKNWRY